MPPQTAPMRMSPCRVAVAGEAQADTLRAAGDTLAGITLVASYRDVADLEARGSDAEADVL
ncbi:MAG: hypothetical protein WCH04_03895 [Gammaproteobacteria bacterium]